MSKFEIRKLTYEDADAIIEVAESQNPVMKSRRNFDVIDFMIGIFHAILVRNEGTVWGAFNDGRLSATLGYRELHMVPSWVTTALLVNHDISHLQFDPRRSGLLDLMHTYYRAGESQGIIRHYSARHADTVDLEMRMWDRATDLFKKRYLRQDEAFVKTGALPTPMLYQSVMGYSPHPYDVIIRSVSLNPNCYDIRTGWIEPYPIPA